MCLSGCRRQDGEEAADDGSSALAEHGSGALSSLQGAGSAAGQFDSPVVVHPASRWGLQTASCGKCYKPAPCSRPAALSVSHFTHLLPDTCVSAKQAAGTCTCSCPYTLSTLPSACWCSWNPIPLAAFQPALKRSRLPAGTVLVRSSSVLPAHTAETPPATSAPSRWPTYCPLRSPPPSAPCRFGPPQRTA